MQGHTGELGGRVLRGLVAYLCRTKHSTLARQPELVFIPTFRMLNVAESQFTRDETRRRATRKSTREICRRLLVPADHSPNRPTFSE